MATTINISFIKNIFKLQQTNWKYYNLKLKHRLYVYSVFILTLQLVGTATEEHRIYVYLVI